MTHVTSLHISLAKTSHTAIFQSGWESTVTMFLEGRKRKYLVNSGKPLLTSREPLTCFQPLWSCLFPEWNINGSIQWVAIYSWLFSLSRIFVRPIRGAACWGSLFLLFGKWHFIVQLFHNSSGEGLSSGSLVFSPQMPAWALFATRDFCYKFLFSYM